MSDWQKPKTTKLYLNPPKSERMIMLWPDFKVVNSVIKRNQRQGAEDAHGFILLFGAEHLHIPWQTTVHHTREDGIPVHKQEFADRELVYTMESFCSMDRVPATYTRVVVKNANPWAQQGRLSLIPRSGRETYMMGMNSDGYGSYEPRAELWGMLPSDWSMAGETIRNGVYAINVRTTTAAAAEWIVGDAGAPLHLRHLYRLDFELPAESEFVLDIALTRGDGRTFDYETEKAATERAWRSELSAIRHYPRTGIAFYRKMYLHLIAQMLQMIASHEGEAYTTLRQGGLERGIWPTEAAEFLVGLDAAGLYHHTEAVYEYFRAYQIKEGDEKGRVPSMIARDWANNTGATLWGLSQHLTLRGDRKLFGHFRTMLMNGYDFIERTRVTASAAQRDGSIAGLFPAMAATDWGEQHQSWCWTDAWNVLGYDKLAGLLALFDDPDAERVRESLAGYRETLEQVLASVVRGHEDDDEILIPNIPGIAPTDPPTGPYHHDGPPTLIRAGIIKPDSPVFVQVENYMRNRGLMNNGLCGLMTDSLLLHGHAGDKWAGHTWYTTYADICWFYGWLERGEFDKAEATFQALVKYSMSGEFYVAERYADNDPTFAPWQPNGSGSARILLMMFDCFKTGAYAE